MFDQKLLGDCVDVGVRMGRRGGRVVSVGSGVSSV